MNSNQSQNLATLNNNINEIMLSNKVISKKNTVRKNKLLHINKYIVQLVKSIINLVFIISSLDLIKALLFFSKTFKILTFFF